MKPLHLPMTLRGRVIAGAGRGKMLGFPTLNLAVPKPIPSSIWGVYACWVNLAGGERRRGMAHVGPAATFGEADARLEVHVLDWPGSAADEEVTAELVARLRETRRFARPDELVAQMQRDAAAARRVLARVEPPPATYAAPRPGSRAGRRGVTSPRP